MGTPDGEPSRYDQGLIAGRIDARLAGHDKHFADLNGSVGDLAAEVHTLNLGIQRIMDTMAADKVTRLATAEALKDAEEARRNQSAYRWSPMAKVITVIVALAAVLTAYITYTGVHHP